MGRYQRVMPSERGLRRIGEILLESELVPVSTNRARTIREFVDQNPVKNDKLARIMDTGRDVPMYRPIRPKDAIDEKTDTTRLRAVRLQHWRVRFDAPENRLWCERFGGGVELGDWG